MTLEKLLGLTADELDKITDQALEDICKPFFNVTRPGEQPELNLASKAAATKAKKPLTPEEIQSKMNVEKAKLLANQQMAAMGIKLRIK